MSTNDKIVENVTNNMNSELQQQVAVPITTPKYSMPFYICPASLFNNRGLKRKRRKWSEKCKNLKNNTNKTENEPSLTINLLTDDEDESQNEQELWLQQQQTQQLLQQMYFNPVLLKGVTSNEPPPLVPLSKTRSTTANTTATCNKVNQNLQHGLFLYTKTKKIDKNNKKQSKKRQPRVTPILLNSESIVLSDDSDPEFITNKNNNDKSPSLSLLPELTLTAINSNNNNHHHHNNSNYDSSLNVSEEEVTVSLVPRHAKINAQQMKKQKAAAAAATANNNVEVFPMLPDETIVHTVIANRTYELSLTKLREGLAQGEQTSPTTARDGLDNPDGAQAGQISLKLSSDLSISLISDDEENDSEECLSNSERALLSAELLQRQQPQLSVQQVNLAASTSKQPPKRRKLG